MGNSMKIKWDNAHKVCKTVSGTEKMSLVLLVVLLLAPNISKQWRYINKT